MQIRLAFAEMQASINLERLPISNLIVLNVMYVESVRLGFLHWAFTESRSPPWPPLLARPSVYSKAHTLDFGSTLPSGARGRCSRVFPFCTWISLAWVESDVNREGREKC